MSSSPQDVTIVGGGIIGLATAMALTRRPGLRPVVLEKEDQLAAHQTGHNSGVIHAGLYYRPGSLKARLCTAGREALYRLCEEHGIAHGRCGKVVIAVDQSEAPRLEDLERRGRDNGLEGLRRLSPAEIREIEPHAAGVAGLFVPQTGIVDFTQVTSAFAEQVRRAGGEIRCGARLVACHRDQDDLRLVTTGGEIRSRHLIACAGLHADRVARMCGLEPGVRIIPFRGEYWKIAPGRESLVRNLIYPVPDPQFPFLGVHLTRMIQGGVEAGPTAVLALRREGYARWGFAPRDAWETLTHAGLWRMARRHWRMGLAEWRRSLSRRAVARAIQRLVPEIRAEDLHPAPAGIRAQALAHDGTLVDDFHLIESPNMIHVLNAPSPAATAAIAIGEHIAARASEMFDLG